MLSSTAITEIRARLQELSPDFWTATEVLNALNEGVKRFSAQERWPWLQTVVTNGSLTAGTADFTLPENVDPNQAINVAVYFSGDTRPRRPARLTAAEGFELATRRYTSQAEPEAFFIASASDADNDGQYIYVLTFVPAMTRNATIKYLYHRVPAVVTGSETLDIPEAYAMGAVAFATGTLWLKELQDSRKADEQFTLYNQVVDDAKKNHRKFLQDTQFTWGGGGPARWEDPDYVLQYGSISAAGGLG